MYSRNNNSPIVIDFDRWDGYIVRFSFDVEIKDVIKDIPGSRWSPAMRAWLVDEHLGVMLKEDLEPWADRVRWMCPVPVREPYNYDLPFGTSPYPMPEPETSDPFAAVLSAVGPERQEAVFRALSKVLHPDTATGDNDLMRQLLDARKTA